MLKPLLNKTILLTGAGGPAMSGMISLLRDSGAKIITVDMLPQSSGFYLSDKSYVVPAGDSPDFLSCIKSICRTDHVSAVVSVVDEELPHVALLEDMGIPVIQPRLAFVDLALDKYRCMKMLASVGLPSPATFLLSDYKKTLPYPIFIKPRVGRGSRGAARIDNDISFDSYIANTTYSLDNLIVQPFIEGDEYTVSVVVSRDGVVHSVVPKKIIKKAGVTKLAVTKVNPVISRLCNDIQFNFKADGPFNVQLIVDRSGVAYPFEINPRFSTSTTLTAASGVNELVGLILLFLDPTFCYNFPSPKDNIVLVRHVVDHFMPLDEFDRFNINSCSGI